MAWKTKETTPPKKEVPKPATEKKWSVVEYSAIPERLVIKNEETGDEIYMIEAITELLNRTE